jgi:VanZ family protein
MRKLLRWLPAVIWMGVIFFLSHQTGDRLHSFLPFFHRFLPAMESFDAGHFAAYFILACTILWGLGKPFATVKGKLFVVLLSVIYGITDEFHQSFVDGRTPDTKDLRNDAIGAALAMIVVSLPPIHRFFFKWRDTRKY